MYCKTMVNDISELILEFAGGVNPNPDHKANLDSNKKRDWSYHLGEISRSTPIVTPRILRFNENELTLKQC